MNSANDKIYEYEVAFSFLSQDEALATQINDLLQDSIKTFLYSKKQEQVAGKDGEEAFNSVFGGQARVAVVLYREAWGSTPWTRVEATAIRNRAFEHGYDFTIFIPLDDPPRVPEWLPKSRLYVGLNRWGLNGAEGVIAARVQELGGSPHEETVQERAERLRRKLTDAENRKKFLSSEAGVRAAERETAELFVEIEQMIGEISKSCNLSFVTKKTDRHILYGPYLVVVGNILCLSIGWHGKYANTLWESELDLSLWDGHPPFPGVIVMSGDASISHQLKFNFDTGPNGKPVWHEPNPHARLYITKDLATFALKLFMDAEEKAHIERLV